MYYIDNDAIPGKRFIGLLVEAEGTMTTVLYSHVKDKNCIFTAYQLFVTGKILVCHLCFDNMVPSLLENISLG